MFPFVIKTIQRLGKTWIPEPDEFEDLIFSCGSVVWAKQGKFVMWPGMIDFCPDNNTFTWTEKVSQYHNRLLYVSFIITI